MRTRIAITVGDLDILQEIEEQKTELERKENWNMDRTIDRG